MLPTDRPPTPIDLLNFIMMSFLTFAVLATVLYTKLHPGM